MYHLIPIKNSGDVKIVLINKLCDIVDFNKGSGSKPETVTSKDTIAIIVSKYYENDDSDDLSSLTSPVKNS